ncbi:MAG: hypothetical protein KF894_27870 [Labilithrix sp.]|nr:hypothetical protein [Labilithrix sp.]
MATAASVEGVSGSAERGSVASRNAVVGTASSAADGPRGSMTGAPVETVVARHAKSAPAVTASTTAPALKEPTFPATRLAWRAPAAGASEGDGAWSAPAAISCFDMRRNASGLGPRLRVARTSSSSAPASS